MNIFERRGSFDPVDLAAMAKAYDLGCIAIRRWPATDKERLAAMIVEFARRGERDVIQLSVNAVNAVTSHGKAAREN
jgi:hypothetical protein